ncbi:MAG TPA: hypothetical protein VHA79_13850 [Mycobacteriales bacterium]|mgnify:CR=1 FL=1|jgi:hypothetical protein|nr:hypothetical protein [Mycobacteriales bacterium]
MSKVTVSEASEASSSSGAIDFGAESTRLRGLTDPASLLPTYAGILIALVGFALLGFAWSKVAGLVDVWRQMPYVVSAGLPGLGLVMTGLIVVNVSSRRQDGAERARQMDTLTEALRDLQKSLDK